MNKSVDELFQRARLTEPELSAGEFLSTLKRRLDQSSGLSDNSSTQISNLPEQPKYEWLLVLAAAVATMLVFTLTPISFWIGAIAYQEFSATTLLSISAVTLTAVMACFAFLESGDA